MKLYTVCWNTFTTGIPRTYSVLALLILSSADWYSAMNFLPLPDIICMMQTTEMITVAKHARPIRQSNTKSRITSETNMATVPEMSARL